MKTMILARIALIMVLSLSVTNLFAKTKFKYSDQKKIEKSFAVNPDVVLDLDIKYGDVTVIPRNTDKVEVQVVINASSNNEDDAADAVNQYVVDFNANSNRVAIKGYLASVKSNLFGRVKVNIDTDFIITVPIEYVPNIRMIYGDFDTSSIKSSGVFDFSYGDMTISNLDGNDNKISMKYGDLKTSFIAGGVLDVMYSDVEITEAASITMSGKYSEIAMLRVGSLEFNSMYGELKVEKLTDQFICDDLGWTDIEMYLAASVSKFNIAQARYGELEISHSAGLNFVANVETSYSNVDLEPTYKILKSNKSAFKYDVEFANGASEKSTSIDISSKYCDIEFERD